MKIPFISNLKSKKSGENKINFIDLSRQRASRNKLGLSLKNIIDKNIQTVMDHGQYILGPEVKKLESKLSKFIGTKNCIGVSSGTDALLLALMSLGINENDEIITTSFSFFATAEVICLLKAKPIFVDINPFTYNIDYDKIEEKINSRTKAIIAVSLYGQPANFSKINEIASKYSIPVIEDAAQSFGAEHHGVKSCNLSTIGVTSFFPSKPLGCYGDGGACFTNDKDLADRIRKISLHGQEKRYNHTHIGINGRLDTLQAAILLAKLDFYPSEIKNRGKLGLYYEKKLNEINIKHTPFIEKENNSVYAQFTIQINNRNDFQKELKDEGIPTAIHYPKILPMQPIILNSDDKDVTTDNKQAFIASKRVISLPFHPWLKESEIDFIVEKIDKLIKKNKSYTIEN